MKSAFKADYHSIRGVFYFRGIIKIYKKSCAI
jgi:hypothetical protein